MLRIRSIFLLAAALCCGTLPTAVAQTVWSGLDFSFTKQPFANVSLPENQDRITENVWITRASSSGIYNAQEEGGFSSTSPTDTEWATDMNNPGDTIAAANFANLDFVPWIDAYGGLFSGELPTRLTSRDAVLHLITDDIYIDVRFTSWAIGNSGGGGFSYLRAVPPSGPETTGDYNLDGVVDAADYVHWRKTVGDEVPEGTGADGIPDGTIDEDDYDFWADHFAETVAASAPTPTPEPSAAITALLFLSVSTIARRSREVHAAIAASPAAAYKTGTRL